LSEGDRTCDELL
jgi:hypothetical protein